MAQFAFGPIYCETPDSSIGAVFPIEPANTISNAVIVMFGLMALYFVIKRAPRAYDLYFLCALLIANGIGSGLWHGLRDRSALFFEVQAGLFVLFGIAFCWSPMQAQLYSWRRFSSGSACHRYIGSLRSAGSLSHPW